MKIKIDNYRVLGKCRVAKCEKRPEKGYHQRIVDGELDYIALCKPHKNLTEHPSKIEFETINSKEEK